MSLGHGAKIVTNGLVFAYDMGPNPGVNKSWKGKPTTNLHTNTDTLSGWYFVDSSYSNGRLIAGTSSAAHFVLQDKSVVSGTVYTQSVEVKYDGVRYFQIAPSTGFSTNFAAFDLVDGTVAGGNTSAASIADIGNGYYRCSYTATATSTTSSGRMAFGPNESSTSRLEVWVGNGANGVLLRNPQIEANSFATPFINGTRSNTEALLDWTGNNTITADSLIYDSDGTFRFDGTTQDNRCTITPSTELSSLRGTTGITVESWVNYSSYSGGTESYSVITCWGAPWVWLVENPSSRLRFRITAGGADVNIADTSNHALNTWIQVVGTYDGATKKIYVNGVLKNSSAQTGVLGSPGGTPKIGTYQGTNYCMSGKIGDVKIYNRALTADEITTNFNALRGRYGI